MSTSGSRHGRLSGSLAEAPRTRQRGPPAQESRRLIQEGNGTWVVNGQEFEAGAGDILVIKAGDVHSFENTGHAARANSMSISVRASFRRICEVAVVNPSRAVTFVPGAAGAGEFWSPVVQQLPQTWDIDVIDLPGLGAVPAQAGIGTYDDLVEYVRARTSRPSALVAQSMGAYIALSLALRYPDAVTHLVLVAATGGVDVSTHGGVDWRADYISAFPTAEPWARASVPDLTDRLSEICVPVLLIWAARAMR